MLSHVGVASFEARRRDLNSLIASSETFNMKGSGLTEASEGMEVKSAMVLLVAMDQG